MKRISLALLLLLTLAGEARADNAANKLGRGIGNIFFGWGEFFRQIEIAQNEQGTTVGLFSGLAQGAVWTVGRTGMGVLEVATFFIPGYENYEPIMEPEFVFTDVGKT